jgi:hypothetical protein
MTLKEFLTSSADHRMPTMGLNKQTGATYDAAGWPCQNAADSQQVRDDISKMARKHALKFGA